MKVIIWYDSPTHAKRRYFVAPREKKGNTQFSYEREEAKQFSTRSIEALQELSVASHYLGREYPQRFFHVEKA